MRDLGGTGGCAASADEGIDLVNDPIIRQKNGEECSQQPECPAPALPGCAEGGVLHGDADEIGGTVTGVRQQSQDDEEK